MNIRSPVLALLLTLSGACAWAQTSAPAAVPAVEPPAALPAPGKEQDKLPAQDLTGQILYQFLLAEIAAQRGQFALAASAFLDLANSTRDPRIARRAAEIVVAVDSVGCGWGESEDEQADRETTATAARAWG